MRTWSVEEIKTKVQVEMEIGGFWEEVEGGWEGDEWCSLCRRETNRCTLGREGYLREEGEKLRKNCCFCTHVSYDLCWRCDARMCWIKGKQVDDSGNDKTKAHLTLSSIG
jgi:hypothetical protein